MQTVQSKTQQLVAFKLSDEEYGVEITQVQEIVRMSEITRIPGMPDFIEGVMNLRGKIIPVIDLRKRFLLPGKAVDDKSRIVVVNVSGQIIGLIVDSVSEVINLSEGQITPIPSTIAAIDAEYLDGVVNILEKRMVILLNLEKLLSDIAKIAIERLNANKG